MIDVHNEKEALQKLRQYFQFHPWCEVEIFYLEYFSHKDADYHNDIEDLN